MSKQYSFFFQESTTYQVEKTGNKSSSYNVCFFCLGTEVPRRSAGSDYDRRWWYVSRARAMMHDDAYRARALYNLARQSTKDKQTGSAQAQLRLAVTTR